MGSKISTALYEFGVNICKHEYEGIVEWTYTLEKWLSSTEKNIITTVDTELDLEKRLLQIIYSRGGPLPTYDSLTLKGIIKDDSSKMYIGMFGLMLMDMMADDDDDEDIRIQQAVNIIVNLINLPNPTKTINDMFKLHTAYITNKSATYPTTNLNTPHRTDELLTAWQSTFATICTNILPTVDLDVVSTTTSKRINDKSKELQVVSLVAAADTHLIETHRVVQAIAAPSRPNLLQISAAPGLLPPPPIAPSTRDIKQKKRRQCLS